MKIRAAALSDHKELAHLSKVLGYPIEEEVLIEGLKRIIAEEDHLLLVAEIEGKAVGMIEAYWRSQRSFAAPSSWLCLQSRT